MKSIKNEVINEFIINKSKFITILTKINSKEDIFNILEKYKNTYKGATHYCYAYILDNMAKCDDDGEPSGTAGMPILNVLEKNNLTNILCIVIRYFGGIKLGSGGLIRAYAKGAREALEKANITNLEEGFYLEIEFPYDNLKQIDYVLKNAHVQKEFKENIIYKFSLSINEFLEIENTIEKFIIKKEPILISV